MAEGGSFFGSGVGEPNRRAFFGLDRRLGEVQAALATDITDHVADADPHPQYMTQAESDARYYTESEVDSALTSYLPLSGGTLTGALSGTNTTMSKFYVSGTNGLTAVTGDYGTVQTTGAGTGGWEGYNINGWVAFMANSSTGNFGIYDDQNSKWAIYCDFNGYVQLRYSGATKLETQSGGVNVTGTMTADYLVLNAISSSEGGEIRLDPGTSSSYTKNVILDNYADRFRIHDGSNVYLTLRMSDGLFTGTTKFDVLSVSNEIQAGNGSSTDPSYTFTSDGDCGMYRVTTNVVGITAGGTVAQFKTDGLHLASGDWFRTYGSTGWYNGTHNGGMYMTDATWVRVYNGKRLICNSDIRTDTQLQSTRSSTGNIGGASLNLGMGNGSGVILTMNSTGYGPLITIGLGEIFYVRNYLNSGWATLQAYLVNHSSIHSKERIVTLGDIPSSVGAASNTLEAFDAIEKVRQLRPVSYYWKEQDALPRMPTNADGTPNTRRIDALTRLNKIRSNRGMGDFTADYLKHVCGRDCDNTVDNPCFRYNNYVTGKIGFIAQEVGALLPEAAELSEERNEYESVDTLALVAVLTKALQEIDARLSVLEPAT